MGNERELMVDEHAKRFGDTVEPAMDALMLAREAVEPVSEAIIQLMSGAPVNPGIQVLGEHRRLLRVWAGGELLQLLLNIVGQIELVKGLGRFYSSDVPVPDDPEERN